jgi:hypothetical protein
MVPAEPRSCRACPPFLTTNALAGSATLPRFTPLFSFPYMHFTIKTFLGFFITAKTAFAFYHLAVVSMKEEDSMIIKALRQCSPDKQGVNPIMRRFYLMVMVLLTALFCNSGPAWSQDRFVDMGDGTVLDTWQKVRWLKNANCFGAQTWADAMAMSYNLLSGMCGLTDGSVAGTWRLPDYEVQSHLLDPQYTTKDSLSAAFTNFQVFSNTYWSYTTFDDSYLAFPFRDPDCLDGVCAYWVSDITGAVAPALKSLSVKFWPVRDGHFGWITVSPSIPGKDYGSVTPNTTSASQAFTISNNGTMPVFINIVLSGGDSSMFALDKGDGSGGTCGATPTLDAGSSCTVSASFKPTKPGGKSTYLWINTDATMNPNTYILLTGNYLDPNVSWWKAENDANDGVSGNNGTMTGGTYAPGKIGQAFSFDGTAQYVSVPSSSTMDVYGTHSVAFWVKPNALPTAGMVYPVVSKWVDGYEHKQVHVNADGRITYFLYGTTAGSGITSATALQTGVWTHVAATYDGKNMKIFLNGVQDASIAAAGDVGDGTGTLYLGYNPDTTFAGGEAPFNGLLDEVGWFNRALSPIEVGEIANMPPDAFTFTAQTGLPLNMDTESNPITVTGISYVTAISISNGSYAISTNNGVNWSSWTNAAGYVAANNQVKVAQRSSSNNSTLTTATLTIGGITGTFDVTTAPSGAPDANGLVAWWKGDNNVYDTMGGNNGTLNGEAGYATGKLGQAFSFDGSEQYVSIPRSNMDVFSIGRTHSVAFWVKIAGKPAAGKSFYIVNKWEDRYEDMLISIDEYGKVHYFLFGTSGSGVTSTNALTPGVWTNVVVTYDGDSMNIYINGLTDASSTVSGTVGNGTGNLYFVYNPERTSQGNEAPFSGQLDEVEWYNRALSSAEIAAMLPRYTLAVSVSGTGSGTIASTPQGANPAGISCTSESCTTTYPFNTPVTLTATLNAITTFGSWGGDCNGSGACGFTMDTDKTITASLIQAPLAKNTTCDKTYPTLAEALTDSDRAAVSGDELLLLGAPYDEAVLLSKGFVLNGGWYATYLGLSGLPTTLNGDLTIQNGGSTVGGVDVKGKLVIQGGSLQANGVTVRP